MLHGGRAGKAVLCEKPIDLDIATADALVVELERARRPVMLAFNRRFDPSNAALRRAIDAGEIGEVRQVIITSRDPGLPPRDYVAHSGGIFRDMVIHDFDMARFLLAEEPVEVYAPRPAPSTRRSASSTTTTRRWSSCDRVGRQCLINCCREAAYGYDQRFEILGATGCS